MKLGAALLLAFWLCSDLATAAPPTVVEVRDLPAYSGNPDARILSFRFSDGMAITGAFYSTSSRRGLPPVGVISGYTMDMSYLHPWAKSAQSRGYDSFVIQPPGNGRAEYRSQMPNKRDGYHNTIEGLGALYLDSLSKEISSYYGGRKINLMGHSRAGYQLRFYLSGLRFDHFNSEGDPVLSEDPQAQLESKRYIENIVSLASPLKADEKLVKAAQALPVISHTASAMIEWLESEHTKNRRNLEILSEAARRIDRFNLGLLLNPFDPRRISMVVDRAEEEALDRTVKLLLGERSLDSVDRMFLRLGRLASPNLVGSEREVLEKLQQVQWMTGTKVNKNYYKHMLKHASRQGPTQVAAEEMSRISSQEGLSGWRTMGVDDKGQTFSALRQIIRNAENAPNYHIIEAEEDGSWQASEREARLLKAKTRTLVTGGHGGVIMSDQGLKSIQCLIDKISNR